MSDSIEFGLQDSDQRGNADTRRSILAQSFGPVYEVQTTYDQVAQNSPVAK